MKISAPAASAAKRAALLSAAIVLVCLAADASYSDAAAQPAAAATQSARIEPKAKQLLSKAISAYRSLRSYQDEGQFTLETRLAGKQRIFTASARTAYAKPNKFAVAWQATQFYCDGKTLWVYADRKKRYLQRSVDDLSKRNGDVLRVRSVISQPILSILLNPADSVLAESSLVRATYEGQTDINGRKCHRVVMFVKPAWWFSEAHGGGGKTHDTMTPHDDSQVGEADNSGNKTELVRKELYIDAETYMLNRLVIDETEVIKALFGQGSNAASGRIERVVRRFNAGRIRLNEPIPKERFIFKPPAGAKQADTLLGLFRRQEPSTSVAAVQPAPNFELSDLSGKKVRLTDFRGKVVVLDFWATWCGPCRMELPHIEKIHRDLAGKGLVVLGMNLAEQPSAVRKFVQANKLTFRVLLDANGKVADAYEIEGIPHVVLIDRQGRIRKTQSGYSPGLEKTLRKKIEQLLAEPTIVQPAKD